MERAWLIALAGALGGALVALLLPVFRNLPRARNTIAQLLWLLYAGGVFSIGIAATPAVVAAIDNVDVQQETRLALLVWLGVVMGAVVKALWDLQRRRLTVSAPADHGWLSVSGDIAVALGAGTVSLVVWGVLRPWLPPQASLPYGVVTLLGTISVVVAGGIVGRLIWMIIVVRIADPDQIRAAMSREAGNSLLFRLYERVLRQLT